MPHANADPPCPGALCENVTRKFCIFAGSERKECAALTLALALTLAPYAFGRRQREPEGRSPARTRRQA